MLKLATDVKNWRFGLRGEQAVAEKLADRTLSAAGYSAFHDVPGNGYWTKICSSFPLSDIIFSSDAATFSLPATGT